NSPYYKILMEKTRADGLAPPRKRYGATPDRLLSVFRIPLITKYLWKKHGPMALPLPARDTALLLTDYYR
ncbi:hypothetical protein, partial [Salmonella enterica]|uniref:hypothetical protein n=1 Tax=Salmonella enterica TaxID=28901 RepID=UPI002A74B9B6